MNRRSWMVLAAVLALVGITAAFLGQLRARQILGPPGLRLADEPMFSESGTLVQTNQVYLPRTVLDFTSTNLPVAEVELGYLPKDTVYGRRRYRAPDGFQVDIGVVLMGMDRTSIHKPQICLDGQGWKIERSEPISVPLEKPHPYDLPVMKLTASKAFKSPRGQEVHGRAVFLYWFVSENRLTAQHAERMWWTVSDLARTGVFPRWAYVSYLAFCLPGQEPVVFERMKELLVASVPEFQRVSGPRRGD